MVYIAALSLAMLAAVACLTMQRENLPSLALIMYAAIPIGYSAAPPVLTILTPSFLVIAIWIARERRAAGSGEWALEPRQGSLAYVCAFTIGLFVWWLLVKTVDSESIERAVAWTGAFALLALLPLFAVMNQTTTSRLKATWILLGAALSTFGLLEFYIGANPLYAGVYGSAPFPIHQYWSSYRITTSLGHPLWNSLFFAISASMGVGRFAETGKYRWLALGALSVMGIFLTVSRSGVIATTLAVLFVTLAALFQASRIKDGLPRNSTSAAKKGSDRMSRALVILAMGALGAFAIVQSPMFQERSSSLNGVASTAARFELVPIALDISEEHSYLGSGAGNSNITALDSTQAVVVENSYLQILLSLGAPGLILFLAILIAGTWAALRARSLAVAGGLVAYSVSIGGFNWLEANRPGLILLGLLLAMAWSDLAQRETQTTGKVPNKAVTTNRT